MSTAAASGRQISGHVDGSDQDNSAEPPRVKRWAPRSRTGCLGCRARRVKCDEGRPKCKSCQKRNMDCFYELNPPGSALSSDSMPIPSILIRPKPTVTRSSDDSAGHSMCDVSQPACRRCAYSGLLSPKPEALPGVGESHSRTGASTVANCSGSQRYGVTAPPPSTSRGLSVRRQRKPPSRRSHEVTLVYDIQPPDWITKSQAIPIKYHRPQGKNPANFEAFTAFILAYRITQISRDQGTLTQPSEAYHTKHLWERLYTCIFNQITCINNEIARLDSSDAQRNRVLTRIQGIKCVEIMLQSPIWRNHMEGFLSLLRFCGGAKFAQAQPAVIRNGKGMIMESILANSVAPPDNQIIGVSFFTTEELMFFHREILHPSLPCPTDLFWGIIETNKLRVKMHSNPGLGYLAAALTILQRINAFQPTAWKESSYELPNIPEVPLIATIYQLAVGLYCLMALQDAGLGSMDKAEQCRALLASLEVAWRLEHCRDALNWPLAVVGCALADGGTPSEQAFVCQCLKDAAQHVFAVHPLVILSTLKRFWASGMTHWDKCWREPCPIMG